MLCSDVFTHIFNVFLLAFDCFAFNSVFCYIKTKLRNHNKLHDLAEGWHIPVLSNTGNKYILTWRTGYS